MVTDSFILKLLKALNLSVTKTRVNFLRAWSTGENTPAKNNPFATTWDMRSKGATLYNSIGVQNYPSEDIGVSATAQTLQQSYGKFKPIHDILINDWHVDEHITPALKDSFRVYGGTPTYANYIANVYKDFKNKDGKISGTTVQDTDPKKKVCPTCGQPIIS